MRPSEESPAGARSRGLLRLQTGLSLALLATLGATFLGLWKLATSPRYLSWVREESIRQAEEDPSVLFADRGGYLFTASKLFLEDVPAVDHRRGGVFFLGASNLVSGMRPWELRGAERELVHNYGVAGASLSQQSQIVDYLLRYRGFLSGDPADTLVVYCLTYEAAAELRFFGEYFQDGLFAYDEEGGLRPVEMSGLERWLRVARLRVTSFLQLLPRTHYLGGDLRLHVRVLRAKERSERYRRLAFREEMGEDWLPTMEAQLGRWEETVALLTGEGAHVVAVLLPAGSWQRELEYDAPFARRVEGICRRRSVELVDLRELLPDSSYADHAHYNFRGTRVLHDRLMEIARAHLSARGFLTDGG